MQEPAQARDVPAVARAIVAEALARNLDEVRIDSLLMDELGAQSIDFLDIVFKLEQTFAIQITRGALEKAARGDMSEEEFAPAGVISPAGCERLRLLMPESASRIRPGMRPAQILTLFTPQTFVNIVDAKLMEKSG